MAKRIRAAARRRTATESKSKLKSKSKPTAKPKSVAKVPVCRTYTPELLANGRQRYERTDEQIAAIAADFQIHPGSLRRLARRLGWVRYNMTPRDLPAAARLLAQAQELEALPMPPRGGIADPYKPHAPVPLIPDPDASPPLAGGGKRRPATDEEAHGFDVTVIARLERQVMEELATVEAMRAQLKGLPRRPRAAETTARTLTILTDTLQRLQRLRCVVPQTGQTDDDFPTDLDEFRDELARRIDAFVASRTDPRDAERDATAPRVDAAGG